MYILTLIFLGICILIIYHYLKQIKEKRRGETWLASQPAEAVIQGRRKAAEKGRALQEEKIDCRNFIEEFEKSEDPEIQKLVEFVRGIEYEEFEFSYWKSLEKRISALENATEEERLNKRLNVLLDYGFRNITFPIAIINDSISRLIIISTLEEYAFKPEHSYWPFKSDAMLIDSNGMQYNLIYHGVLEFHYPNKKIAEVDLNTVKQLLNQRLREKKVIPIIESSNTIKELFGRLYEKDHG